MIAKQYGTFFGIQLTVYLELGLGIKRMLCFKMVWDQQMIRTRIRTRHLLLLFVKMIFRGLRKFQKCNFATFRLLNQNNVWVEFRLQCVLHRAYVCTYCMASQACNKIFMFRPVITITGLDKKALFSYRGLHGPNGLSTLGRGSHLWLYLHTNVLSPLLDPIHPSPQSPHKQADKKININDDGHE